MNERICGAKLRGKERHCRTKVVSSNGRCRLHGGATPKGMASPNYKHGRFSKYMPTHILDNYGTFLNDGGISTLRHEMALCDLIADEHLEAAFAVDRSAAITGAIGEIEAYLHGTIDPKDRDHLLAALAYLEAGSLAGLAAVTGKLLPVIEQRRKLVDAETKRIAMLNQNLTPEQALMFVRALGDAIKRHVHDDIVLRAIYEDFDRLMGD